MAAVTANIGKYKTKTGIRYRVRITNKRLLNQAKHFNRAGFRTRRDAEAYARQIQDRVSRLDGGDMELGHTFGELVQSYEEQAIKLLNLKDQKLRKTQLAWWTVELGSDLQLMNLTPKRISEALRRLQEKPVVRAPRGKVQLAKAGIDPSPISASTANRYRSALAAVCTFGIKDLHWLDENPVHKTRTWKEPPGRVRYLEPDEIKRLSAAIKRQGSHLQLLYWLGLATGARRGELLSATWDQVRFLDGGSASITLPTSKNEEPRVLPVPRSRAVQLLRLQRIKYRGQSEKVFPTDRPGNTNARWYREWRAALKEAEIQNFRFHDLRHCFASYLAMSGHDHIQIADLTGHKSLAMVKRYAHLNPKARERNAAAAMRHMGVASDGEKTRA